jgi:hypothetical protein
VTRPGTQPFIGTGTRNAAVQTYPVKATHRRNLELPAIGEIARTHFAVVEIGPAEVQASYGAIERLTARPEGRSLSIDLRMNPKVEEAVARETIARYNRFLQEITGYGAKERARRLRKSAAP